MTSTTKQNGLSEFYLVVPESQVARYMAKSDRDYFSKPVPVELLYSRVDTRLLYVRDPHRQCSFPIDPKHLVSKYGLTKRQQGAIR